MMLQTKLPILEYKIMYLYLKQKIVNIYYFQSLFYLYMAMYW